MRKKEKEKKKNEHTPKTGKIKSQLHLTLFIDRPLKSYESFPMALRKRFFKIWAFLSLGLRIFGILGILAKNAALVISFHCLCQQWIQDDTEI